MNFDFGNVLTRAWQIIWKNKVLWIFGVLASCARGGGGGGGGGGNTGYQFGSGDQPPFAGDQFTRQMEQFGQWLTDNWWVIVVIVLVLILISLLFYFIGFVGKIGLIKGTYKAETGATSLVLGELFSESLPFFWRVFGLNFLIGLAFLVIILPLVLIGILTAGVGFICILPLLCILIPVSWIVAVILEQANAAIVIEDLRMFDGFKRGWEIVKANVGPVIIMALILLFGGGIISIIFAVPIFFMIFPLIPSLISGEFQTSALWIAGLCFVAYLPVLILLTGILTAYLQSAWTLTYMRLATPKENAPVLLEANA
jgi:hypothetical protein